MRAGWMEKMGHPNSTESLYVDESGQVGSPAIIFLHDVGTSAGMWKEHMERFAGFHCLAPDLPGHGGSNRVSWISRAETSLQIARLIECHTAFGRAHVVARSLGGAEAYELFRPHAERGGQVRAGVAGKSPAGEVIGMWRVLLIGFLFAHGLVHVAIWAPRYDPEKAPFDPSHSWLIGDKRALARILAFAAAAILVVAAIGLWAHGEWWRPTAVVGLSISTALLLLYFYRWYLFILIVNIGLIVGLAWFDWPSAAPVGA